MNFYTVVWKIEIDARSPEEAACLAADIAADVLDPASEARSFEVTDQNGQVTLVDLNEEGRVE